MHIINIMTFYETKIYGSMLTWLYYIHLYTVPYFTAFCERLAVPTDNNIPRFSESDQRALIYRLAHPTIKRQFVARRPLSMMKPMQTALIFDE